MSIPKCQECREYFIIAGPSCQRAHCPFAKTGRYSDEAKMAPAYLHSVKERAQ